MEPRWTPAFPLAQLPRGGARVLKHPDAQVAVFHLPDGALHAVDNRCPHQGYPLAQGTVSGCVLTCQWHNFKFDLRTGACVMGEEAVRSYPDRVVDGSVEIDLAPSADRIAALWADLDAALTKHETGRIARGVVRLLRLGAPPVELALAAARHDAVHAEYGPTHALAVAAEVGVRGTPGVDPALPIVQALDLAARANVRLPPRAFPTPIDPGDDPVAAGVRVRALVEAEDPAAEALVRGAVARGWRRAELEPWFFQLCADHFLDFGHALIYSARVFDLLDAVGWRDADVLLGSLTWGIGSGTREDLLPGWAGWRKRIATLPSGGSERIPSDALLDADAATAFALVATAEPSAALAALAIAASERLLRFDLAHDADPTLEEGWLDVTHRLTFVEAVRRAVSRGAPDARRLLLQAAHFVASARPLDGPRADLAPRPATLEEAVEAVRTRHPDAPSLAAGYLASHPAEPLVDALEAVVMRDHATRAIILAHLFKTLRAGAAERLSTGDDRPLLAAIRFLASPVRERNVERTVNDAVALVDHGRPPRALTS